ncbi:hypothetical protein BC834DRAFT_880302, partial [Gloeopeniophorella convolvens]
ERFVGPMPVALLLDEFVPEAPKQRPKDKITFYPSVFSKEADFINAIHDAGLCPDIRLVDTSHHSMDRLEPDISVISRAHAFANLPDGKTLLSHVNWETVELWIENNPRGSFIRDVDEMLQEGRNPACHIKWGHEAFQTCDQFVAYAEAIHKSQFRTFSFSIGIFGESCHLFRWDRSGFIYTEPINWVKVSGSALFEFLWRFNFLSPAERGHDPTVCPAEESEAEEALPFLRRHPGMEQTDAGDLYKILVPDDDNSQVEPRFYITPRAIWRTEFLTGRAAFGYIAYDPKKRQLIYLKDFWRVDDPGMQKEGDIYRKLHDAKVPNIAELGPAGDVSVTLEGPHGSTLPSTQRTRTQEFVTRAGRYHWCPGNPVVGPFVHYRLVLETVGVPLSHFT